MRCPSQGRKDESLLLDYCAGRLDEEVAADLGRHAEDCPSCRIFLDAQLSVWEALDKWRADSISPGFDLGLYRRIKEQSHGGWYNRALRPWFPAAFRPSLPVAAVFMLALAVFLLRSPSTVTLPPDVRAEIPDVDQIEKVLEDMEMLEQLDLMLRPEAPSSRSM